MNARANRWIIAGIVAAWIAAVFCSHIVDPGVVVENVTVAADTPAIRLYPATKEQHPIALLAHGATGSKESLFRYGEALAAAGFNCFIIDLPGHGASRQSFSVHEIGFTPARVAQALGPVAVYLGHSMGGGAGAVSVHQAGFAPRLFIALGANPSLGEHGPRLLLLAGQFEEFVSPARLKARTDAQLVLSPWSDHVLELLDPCLVNAAVQAACETVGRTPPSASTFWLWRLAGLGLGTLAAGILLFCLPQFPPSLARARGPFAAAIIVFALMPLMSTWFRWTAYFHRLPLQLVLMLLAWLALFGLGRLKLPRWSLAAIAAALTFVCVIVTVCVSPSATGGYSRFPFHLTCLMGAIITVFLLEGTILGWFAARRGARLDGDIAMAIFVGYAIGQWTPTFF